MSLQFISAVGIFAVALLSSATAQNGVPCHADIFQFLPRHTLNVSRFTGDWYLHEIAGSHIGNFPEPDYKCFRTSLSLPDVDDILNLESTDSFVNKTDGLMKQLRSTITVNNTRSPFTSLWSQTDSEGVESKVIILAADLEFQEWALIYSCAHLGPDMYRSEVVMGVTRSRGISPEIRRFLKALMVGTGFRIGDHHPVDQGSC